MDAVTPAALDVALQVFEELRARRADVDRLRRAQVERAREEAELAQRQYMLARPENRLVVDTLERQWNDCMAKLAQAEAEYARAAKADGNLELSTDTQERIGALASDFPRVWKDPRTSARDRKRMLRLLVEDVTLARNEELIHVHIRWKGGATTSLELPRPRSSFELVRTPTPVIEEIRALATEQTDDQIACTLNSRGYCSGTGKSFTGPRVNHLRFDYGIESYRKHLQRSGWHTLPEIARKIGVHPQTARMYASKGLLHAIRVNGRDLLLFARDRLVGAHNREHLRGITALPPFRPDPAIKGILLPSCVAATEIYRNGLLGLTKNFTGNPLAISRLCKMHTAADAKRQTSSFFKLILV